MSDVPNGGTEFPPGFEWDPEEGRPVYRDINAPEDAVRIPPGGTTRPVVTRREQFLSTEVLRLQIAMRAALDVLHDPASTWLSAAEILSVALAHKDEA